MSADQIILLVYVLLLEMGGLMGFLKAGSKASLIASSIFAAILLLFIFVFPIGYAWIVLAFLLVFFGMRLAKSKKMMPNGMMVILSLIALILMQLF